MFDTLENVDLSSLDLANCTQVQMELLYSKYQLHDCITAEIIKAGAQDELLSLEIPEAFGIDLLVQLVLHKRANIPTLVGLLKKHFLNDDNPAQACTDMLHKALEKDLADWDEFSQTVVMRYDITDDVKAKLEQFQYPLPMVQYPDPLTNNRQTGYVTIRKSVILKNNHHDEDVCLDHLNRANKIPLALNADVVAFVQNRWKNLDKPKEDETYDEFKARKKAFEKYDRTSRDVLDALMAQGNQFWLTHRYDKRGRTYSQGYHVNYQGTDWNKAVIEFYDAEPLNQE